LQQYISRESIFAPGNAFFKELQVGMIDTFLSLIGSEVIKLSAKCLFGKYTTKR